MKTKLIQHLTDNFEAHVQRVGSGVEFWPARDIQHLLGYAEWRNFMTVISKAKVACEVSEQCIANHFVDVNKMVDLGSGSQHEVFEFIRSAYQKRLVALESLKKPTLQKAFTGELA